MRNIFELENDFKVNNGSVFRVFGVNRFDVMKLQSDRIDLNKQKLDFYDFMLVKIPSSTYYLANISLRSPHRMIIMRLECVNLNYFNFITPILNDRLNGFHPKRMDSLSLICLLPRP